MIPCKECLVLAICKSKKEIRCDLLYAWYKDEGSTAVMNRILKNIMKLERESGEPSRFYFISVGDVRNEKGNYTM